MTEGRPIVRTATVDDAKLLAHVAAAAFAGDPVMSWVFPEADTREKQLQIAFGGLVQGFVPTGGTVHVVDDACVTFWRAPEYDYAPQPSDSQGPSPFASDVIERFRILDDAMTANHPHHTAHWYLNVIGTLPSRQGEGLGLRTMEPILSRCDQEGVPAYLESSNPRNLTFYKRQGFVQTGEIPLADGPSLYPMWREPSGS